MRCNEAERGLAAPQSRNDYIVKNKTDSVLICENYYYVQLSN